MAHYAFLDGNNVVVEVIVGRDEHEVIEGITDWELHYSDFRGLSCKRTSYNTRGGVYYDAATNEPSNDQSKTFRGNYAGIGYTYDDTLDAFIPPQPFPSWVLNETTCQWDAPVPYPDDGLDYGWDEDSLSWVAVEFG